MPKALFVSLSVCERTSVAGDDGLSVPQVLGVAVTHSVRQLVVLTVFFGVEDVLPAVSTCLKHTHTQKQTRPFNTQTSCDAPSLVTKTRGSKRGVVVPGAHMTEAETELCVCV